MTNSKKDQKHQENRLKLEAAIKNHRIHDVENLLKRSPGSLQRYNGENDSLLDIAIRAKDIPIMDLLIEKGFNINNVDRNGVSALHLAALLGDLNVFNQVLSYKPDLECKSKERGTVLHFCTEGREGAQNAKILQVLLSKDLELDEPDQYGVTPIMKALNKNNLPLIKMLVESGASLNTPPPVESIVDLADEGSEIKKYLKAVTTAMREQEALDQELQDFNDLADKILSASGEVDKRRNHKRL